MSWFYRNLNKMLLHATELNMKDTWTILKGLSKDLWLIIIIIIIITVIINIIVIMYPFQPGKEANQAW